MILTNLNNGRVYITCISHRPDDRVIMESQCTYYFVVIYISGFCQESLYKVFGFCIP